VEKPRVSAFVRCIESQRDAIRCVSRGSLHTCGGGGGGEATAVAVATGIGAIGIVGEGMGTAEAIGIGAEAIGAAEATGVAEAKNASLAFALCGTAPPRWCQ
jgi:hypothetical protein